MQLMQKFQFMFVPAKFCPWGCKRCTQFWNQITSCHSRARSNQRYNGDTLELAKQKGATVIGPNTPGIMIPDLIKVGIMPPNAFQNRERLQYYQKVGHYSMKFQMHLPMQDLDNQLQLELGETQLMEQD